MSSIKKTIFLSNKQDNNFKGMAVVTLEKKNQNIFGTIKTFNLDNKKNYILGIKQHDKIYKQNIILDNNKYNFILSNTNNFGDDVGCVLLSVDNKNYTPVIWGSDKLTNYKSQIISSLKDTFDKIKESKVISKKEDIEVAPTQTVANQPELTYPNSKYNVDSLHNTNYDNNLRNIRDNNSSHENVFHSAHAQYFKSSNNDISHIQNQEEVITPYHSEVAIASNYATLFESDEKEINDLVDKEITSANNEHHFYEMIAEQLNELFEKYPKERALENLIDNSKWVKIKNIDNKHYVVGIIYNNNDIKYICYGVPGNYSKEPPIELREYSQWLPTDITNPYDNGYWVMYQDADTGENVVIN